MVLTAKVQKQTTCLYLLKTRADRPLDSSGGSLIEKD